MPAGSVPARGGGCLPPSRATGSWGFSGASLRSSEVTGKDFYCVSSNYNLSVLWNCQLLEEITLFVGLTM